LRRHLAVFVLFASALLVAATPAPRPTAKSTPAPAATAAPTAEPTLFDSNEPVVLIYPFDAPSDLDPRTGNAIAQIFAQVLVQTGGVRVLQIPAGIKREDFQKFAHVQHADYYISGYVQPIGQGAAIVTQVVDVNSDISVYSATTQVADAPDVASQALNARTVILEAAGISHPEIATGPASTPTPASTAGASMPINNVLADIFKGRPRPATPAPTPTPSKPLRGVILVHLIGSAQSKTLDAATADLYHAMSSYYSVAMSGTVTSDPSKVANTICGMHRDNTIASGRLDVQHVGGFRPHDSYTFTLEIYACFGPVLYTNTQTNDDFARAVKDAVEAYYTDHPENS